MKSPQLISTHFNQSHRQTSHVTFPDKRAALFLFTAYPDELKTCSHWTGSQERTSLQLIIKAQVSHVNDVEKSKKLIGLINQNKINRMILLTINRLINR